MIEVETMMNLDGAEGQFIFNRWTGEYNGSEACRYVSSVLCLR